MTTPFTIVPAVLANQADLQAVVNQAAPLVFRTEAAGPGFALLDLGIGLSPDAFREVLINVGRAISSWYQEHFGGQLGFVSISRFDQQAVTRPHRDGGPDASILLLGYEPTEVASRVYLLDYTRAALEKGLTPMGFLECCNPAHSGNESLLHAHTMEAAGFTSAHYQILLVNNSTDPTGTRGMLGVLHHAVIPTPRPDRPRFIASVLMGITPHPLDEDQVRAFVADAAPSMI